MIQPRPVSVIVVSRGRPALLRRCLSGIGQLYYPDFEVVVVADAAGLAAISEAKDLIKTVRCDEANISIARNLGLEQAAGEIVAFIDDDAVPEPTWLEYLVAPFGDATVAAVGGFVRARNGISFQWKASRVDSSGHTHPLVVDERDFTVFAPQPDSAIKTEGTNMAFRRDIVANLGGFDPGYRFFMDETDLDMRLLGVGF